MILLQQWTKLNDRNIDGKEVDNNFYQFILCIY